MEIHCATQPFKELNSEKLKKYSSIKWWRRSYDYNNRCFHPINIFNMQKELTENIESSLVYTKNSKVCDLHPKYARTKIKLKKISCYSKKLKCALYDNVWPPARYNVWLKHDCIANWDIRVRNVGNNMIVMVSMEDTSRAHNLSCSWTTITFPKL